MRTLLYPSVPSLAEHACLVQKSSQHKQKELVQIFSGMGLFPLFHVYGTIESHKLRLNVVFLFQIFLVLTVTILYKKAFLVWVNRSWSSSIMVTESFTLIYQLLTTTGWLVPYCTSRFCTVICFLKGIAARPLYGKGFFGY